MKQQKKYNGGIQFLVYVRATGFSFFSVLFL